MQATRRRRRTLLGDRDARVCVCEQLAQGRCCWATRHRPVIFIHQTRTGCRCHVISDIIELRSPNAAGRPLLLEQASLETMLVARAGGVAQWLAAFVA